ncbi:hypothetical protein Q428_09275 [Fervidicella metallireducens AeB]|uniref:DNA mismatch repair protein MutL n=1 Tax=Fervidicella metallireducens AeB TaxID=1403537 RepID=A0A017RU58_9CLOT|nr:DNA mismatch repair endonuclease MutL [Fervidicella metallireducens]EYE88212.1 hypothetical protein Q428_09275 [Fervidicella metallireducens AeB]
MGIIRILDDNTINKIAAGEVIEKPASIIKELVENSIDAGATEISVEAKNGGISYIRVVDNGKGIQYEDMDKAFLRHATSKICSEVDLNYINTLGFRGEALASIAAISKIELMSKTAENEIGNRIYIEGGVTKVKEQCGCPDGTIITIKDVFFNTPARLKFLKSETREGIYITEIMQNLALSNPNISFKYKLNDKLVFSTKGDGDIKAVVFCIYGNQVVNNLIEINSSKEFITIKGYVGNSNIAKSNRNSQSLFVNGRYVKNKTITAAVEAAFKSLITINKFPFYILHMYVNPEFIDVNVHPSKAEIKFQDEQLIFKAVYHSVRDSILSVSSIPKIEDKQRFVSNVPKANTESVQIKISDGYEHKLEKSDNSLNLFKDNLDNQNFDKYVTEPMIKPKYTNDIEEFVHENNEIIELDSGCRKNDIKENECVNNNDNYLNNIDRISKFGPLSIVGQIHFTYIVAEGQEEMYLIDQHAAHERILYEQYVKQYSVNSMQTQNLLVPMVLDLSLSENQIVLDNKNVFIKLGYDIEEFGGNTISIRAVPVILGNPSSKDLFFDILNQLNENRRDSPSTVEKILYTMACKGAVKAGDKLSFKEMNSLIEQLRYCENPYTCPHGRPTIIKMTYLELEKKFKRIQ